MTDVNEPTKEPTNKAAHQEQIRADRACIGCGFNMFGQTVTKEERYGLAIARCPECGEVAALQSYPTMSHWVNRFRSIIAGVWIVLLLGFLGANSMMMMGLSIGATEIAGDQLAEDIGLAHANWIELQTQQAIAAQEDAQRESAESAEPAESDSVDSDATSSGTSSAAPGWQNIATTTTNGITTVVYTAADGTMTTTINGVTANNFGGSYRWSTITPVWIDQELDAYIESVGGVWANLDREFMILFLPATVTSLLAGIFWSVTLLGARRPSVLVVPVIAGVIGAAMALSITMTNGSNMWAGEVAKDQIAMLIVPIMIGVQMTSAMFGIFIGRKVARLVILLALPPRGRVSFALLWTRDGLDLPKPKFK